MRRRVRAVARLGVVAWALTWIVNRSLRRVDGNSMRPTLTAGDLVLVVPAGLVGVRRGSVVVVPDPRDPTRRTIKRVAGVAGDRLEVAGRSLVAGAGQLVVLGDDPDASTDSRVYGPVATADVRAVAVAALRPWRRLPAAPQPVATPARRRPPG
ncbi:MAG: hypothetical protein KY461_00565 [Actinobacteria bacterium]|nr:hypothetical protein [Actinomycetota bacterium]